MAAASKYTKKTDWWEGDRRTWTVAKKSGWMEQCTAHMQSGRILWSYTIEQCKESAIAHATLSSWAAAEPGKYQCARREGWLNDIWSNPNKKTHWSKDACATEAAKHSTLTEWFKTSPQSYEVASKNGWIKDVAPHINTTARDRLLQYGGKLRRWTKETCKDVALQYSTLKEWRESDPASYAAAKRNGWDGELKQHMTELRAPVGYWTKERCIESAKHFLVQTNWTKAVPGAFKSAYTQGWLPEATAHMHKKTRWTLELCQEEARQFSRKTDWSKGGSGGYPAALKNGWLEDCCGHMHRGRTPKEFWTKETCIEDASRHTTSAAWFKFNRTAWQVAKENGWLDECVVSGPKKYKNAVGWTKDACIENARKFATRKQWRYAEQAAYYAAKKNGWLEECSHIAACGPSTKRTRGHWTQERCIESATQYE